MQYLYQGLPTSQHHLIPELGDPIVSIDLSEDYKIGIKFNKHFFMVCELEVDDKVSVYSEDVNIDYNPLDNFTIKFIAEERISS